MRGATLTFLVICGGMGLIGVHLDIAEGAPIASSITTGSRGGDP